MVFFSWGVWWSSVPRTTLRLFTSCPITASRSARVLVSDAARAKIESIVPPSPWNTDTISGFVFGEDVLSVPVMPTNIETLNGGTLNGASFDADLANAMNGVLDPAEAVIFTASEGTEAGNSFLVVDQNGEAGYQAGQDIVIHLVDYTPPPTTEFVV